MKRLGGPLFLLLLLSRLLAPVGVAAQQQERLLTLTVLVRASDGTPLAGMGVHIYTYAGEDTGAMLLADGKTGVDGRVAFDVPASIYGNMPMYRTYSVALYAPPGSGLVVVSEDQQSLESEGDMGVQVVGIGVVVGVEDFTLRLVVRDGQPFFDTAATDTAEPQPFIPGVSDAGPTPTPLVGNEPFLAGPAQQLSPGPTGVPPTQPVATAVVASTPGAGQPGSTAPAEAPFPWTLSVAILALGVIGWYLARRYSCGELQLPAFLRRRRPKWAMDNQPPVPLPEPAQQPPEEDLDG